MIFCRAVLLLSGNKISITYTQIPHTISFWPQSIKDSPVLLDPERARRMDRRRRLLEAQAQELRSEAWN